MAGAPMPLQCTTSFPCGTLIVSPVTSVGRTGVLYCTNDPGGASTRSLSMTPGLPPANETATAAFVSSDTCPSVRRRRAGGAAALPIRLEPERLAQARVFVAPEHVRDGPPVAGGEPLHKGNRGRELALGAFEPARELSQGVGPEIQNRCQRRVSVH